MSASGLIRRLARRQNTKTVTIERKNTTQDNSGGVLPGWFQHILGLQAVVQLTSGSERNHTYARRPVDAHPDFYALWADGHARRPSESTLYFSDRDGKVRRLPRVMDGEFAVPEVVAPPR